MLSMFGVLGLDYWLVRELSRDRRSDRLDASLPLACLLGLGIAVCLVVAPRMFGAPPAVRTALLPAAVYVAATAPMLVMRAGLFAIERVDVHSIFD